MVTDSTTVCPCLSEISASLGDAFLGECDCCHETKPQWALEWTGQQMLCERCGD